MSARSMRYRGLALSPAGREGSLEGICDDRRDVRVGGQGDETARLEVGHVGQDRPVVVANFPEAGRRQSRRLCPYRSARRPARLGGPSHQERVGRIPHLGKTDRIGEKSRTREQGCDDKEDDERLPPTDIRHTEPPILPSSSAKTYPRICRCYRHFQAAIF